MGRPLAWIGVLVFAISWFVPVVKGQDLIGALGDLKDDLEHTMTDAGRALRPSAEARGPVGPQRRIGPGGPSWLPGWQACHFAWSVLTGDTSGGPNGWKAKVLGATCLTNLLMLLTILLLLGQMSGHPLLSLLLLGAAALNASWIYLNMDGGNPFEGLRAGYYLWTASFVLVGLGLMAPPADVRRA